MLSYKQYILQMLDEGKHQIHGPNSSHEEISASLGKDKHPGIRKDAMQWIKPDHPEFEKHMNATLEKGADWNLLHHALKNPHVPEHIVKKALYHGAAPNRQKAREVASARGIEVPADAPSTEPKQTTRSASSSKTSDHSDKLAKIHAAHAAGILTDEERDKKVAEHHAEAKSKDLEDKISKVHTAHSNGVFTDEERDKKIAQLKADHEAEHGKSEKKDEPAVKPKKVANPQKKESSTSSKTEAESANPESNPNFAGSHSHLTNIKKGGKVVGHVATSNSGNHEVYTVKGQAVKVPHSGTHEEAVEHAKKHFDKK